MSGKYHKRVRVLVNPKSGLGPPLNSVVQCMERHWGARGFDLSYQYSNSVEDGRYKTRQAVDDGIETLIVAGGDGMINTVGSELIGTGVALGVIPTGSGNGFARHFNIPLQVDRAAEALVDADRQLIDVGVAVNRPFFVTCGMAADAELVRHFEKSPVRGILPYVLAAAYEIMEYKPRNFRVILDGKETLEFKDVLVFTVANLTQFGGGARIAPQALADDGRLEMVIILRQDVGGLVTGITRLFNGTMDQLPGVITRRFQRMEVHRSGAGAVQVDGELVEAAADVTVRCRKRALTVLVPTKQDQIGRN